MYDVYQKNVELKPNQIIDMHDHDDGFGAQSAQQKIEMYLLRATNCNLPVGMPQPGCSERPQIEFVNLANPSVKPKVPHLEPQPPEYNQDKCIDPENPLGPEVKEFKFTDETIRKGFIRKVYSILTIQICVTLVFILLIGYEKNTRQWCAHHPAMFFCAIGVLFITFIIMACVEYARRRAPLNFIILGVFTIAQSYVVAMATSRFSRDDVVLAITLTATICVALTVFAIQTKWDFTVGTGILFAAIVLVMLFGLIAMYVPGKVMTLLYASLGAFILSIYLVYDTQVMILGLHKYSISPEEYVLGALILYLDIINMFLFILRNIATVRDYLVCLDLFG